MRSFEAYRAYVVSRHFTFRHRVRRRPSGLRDQTSERASSRVHHHGRSFGECCPEPRSKAASIFGLRNEARVVLLLWRHL
jgi:hypothetical protein